MKDLDFIRYLIDIIDQQNTDSSADPSISSEHLPTDSAVIISGGETSDSEHDDVNPRNVPNAIDKDDIFIPPLQQRIEMLKKLTGVNPHDREILAHMDSDDPTAS